MLCLPVQSRTCRLSDLLAQVGTRYEYLGKNLCESIGGVLVNMATLESVVPDFRQV
jgi:hypothetical protein